MQLSLRLKLEHHVWSSQKAMTNFRNPKCRISEKRGPLCRSLGVERLQLTTIITKMDGQKAPRWRMLFLSTLFSAPAVQFGYLCTPLHIVIASLLCSACGGVRTACKCDRNCCLRVQDVGILGASCNGKERLGHACERHFVTPTFCLAPPTSFIVGISVHVVAMGASPKVALACGAHKFLSKGILPTLIRIR